MSLDITTARLTRQQLLRPEFETPAEVVRWFGAMQSQDLSASLWAIGLRLQKPLSEAEVEQALANKSLVRSWPMRGTIHLMPAEDARWMLRLLGPRVDAKAAGNYRRAGLTPETIAKAGEIITQTLQGGKQCKRAELYAALHKAGIATSAQNGEQRGMHLLVHWGRHGLVCITPRQGKQPTFALLDEWLPAGRQLGDDEALAELARRYFQSHGPATIKDFAWWTGLTVTEAKRAVQSIQDSLRRETIENTEYFYTQNPATANPAQAFLLPPYDEYTVAYADRTAVINREQLAAAGYGIGPNLIMNGRIVGTWKRTLQKQSVTATLNPLQPLSAEQNKLARAAADRYAHFLGLKLVLA